MISKELFGVLSLVITVTGYTPYLVSILRRRTKPHAFSRLIWSMTFGITFLGQRARGAGPGAWVNGVSFVFTFVIFLLALFRGERSITRFDWICLLLGLLTVPLWLATRLPLYSVALATVIDLLGYGPTFRKSYVRPQEENISPYLLGIPKHILGILALEAYNFTTLCFPLAIGMANSFLVTMIVWRKRTRTV